MSVSTRALALFSLLAVGHLLSGSAARAEDAQAVAIAEQVLDALGGREAWEATHFVRFTFAGNRTHHWDKWGGRHRLEGTTRDGERYVVLLDLASRAGRAAINGSEVTGEALAPWLERAWGAWVNDTYWLVMPYKLRDPGVVLGYAGREELDGAPHDTLTLAFESVGLTPGDRYWVYVDPETHLVDGWSYILEGQPEEGPATHWRWHGWKRYGGILLASERTDPERGRELPLGDIAVFDELPEEVFTSLSAVAGE